MSVILDFTRLSYILGCSLWRTETTGCVEFCPLGGVIMMGSWDRRLLHLELVHNLFCVMGQSHSALVQVLIKEGQVQCCFFNLILWQKHRAVGAFGSLCSLISIREPGEWWTQRVVSSKGEMFSTQESESRETWVRAFWPLSNLYGQGTQALQDPYPNLVWLIQSTTLSSSRLTSWTCLSFLS